MIRRTLKKKPSLVKNKTGKRKNTKGIKRNRRKVHKTRKRKSGGGLLTLEQDHNKGDTRVHARGIIPSFFKKLMKKTVELAKPSWSSFKDVLPTEKNRIRETVVSEVEQLILDEKGRNVENTESFVIKNIIRVNILETVFELFGKTKNIQDVIERKYKRIFYLYFMEDLIREIDEGKEPKPDEKKLKELYIDFGTKFYSFKEKFESNVEEENPKEKETKERIIYYLGVKGERISSRVRLYSVQRQTSQTPTIITGTASVIQDSDTGSETTETSSEPSAELSATEEQEQTEEV